jgi:acetyl-CoA carboxylase biotin carboxyl carrier protein
MDFNQIQELIRLVSKQKITEFVYKQGDFKLVIRQGSEHNGSSAPVVVHSQPTPMPVAPPPVSAAPVVPPPAPVSTPASTDAPASNQRVIKSPMVGTFYRSAGTDKPSFVKIGDDVEAGATVCIIEAMKLFNEIESDIKGRIVKVFVEDASPVEYDQPLFLVEI